MALGRVVYALYARGCSRVRESRRRSSTAVAGPRSTTSPRRLCGACQLEQMRRGRVGEPGARATGEDRGNVVTAHRRGDVADRVDAAVDRTQAAVAEPALDPLGVDTFGDELTPRHTTMPREGEPSSPGEFGAHVTP
ncbi:MAG: hypothetical protein M3376_12465 [Actinomycetota bacterium]|nr:hypothetical protein [Actinomycetota bacterium]